MQVPTKYSDSIGSTKMRLNYTCDESVYRDCLSSISQPPVLHLPYVILAVFRLLYNPDIRHYNHPVYGVPAKCATSLYII